jgi:hypothetical protein
MAWGSASPMMRPSSSQVKTQMFQMKINKIVAQNYVGATTVGANWFPLSTYG